MAAQILPIELMESDSEIRSGSPLVAGTSLRVSDLAPYDVLAGLTPDQLSAQSISTLPRSMQLSPTTSATRPPWIPRSAPARSCGGSGWAAQGRCSGL